MQWNLTWSSFFKRTLLAKSSSPSGAFDWLCAPKPNKKNLHYAGGQCDEMGFECIQRHIHHLNWVLPRRRRTRSSSMQPTLDSHQDKITELLLVTERNRFCVPAESRYIAPMAVRLINDGTICQFHST
jgi:hypothetical protein